MICDRYRAGKAALVGLAAAAVGTFALSAPAAADIGVTPAEATQGDSARLTLRVPNERPPGYTTKVELFLPESDPIAEVYPMSVPDWAPGLTMRQLAEPAALIHGTETTEVVAAVTWTLVTDPVGDPVEASELSVSLGPLPATNRLVFSVRQTYSDGTVIQWGDAPDAGRSAPALPAPELALIPAIPGAGAAEDGAQTGSGTDGGHGGAAAPSGPGPDVGLSIAMILVLVGAGALVMYPRRRGAAVSPDGSADGSTDAPPRDAVSPDAPSPDAVSSTASSVDGTASERVEPDQVAGAAQR